MIRRLGTVLLWWAFALSGCAIDSRAPTTAESGSLLPSSDGASSGGSSGTSERAGDAGTPLSAAGSTGLGPAPGALQVRETLDFGGVPLQTSAMRMLGIENEGSALIGQIAASVSGPDASDFIVQQNGCTGLAQHASCSLPLAFTPSLAGSRRATLTLTQMAGATRTVALSGVGLGPGSLTLEPVASGTAYLGDTLVATTSQSVAQTLIVTNTGQMASGILSIGSLQGAFHILPPTGRDCVSNSTNLQPTDTCTLQVAFAPTERGADSAMLTVSSVSAGSASIPVSGVGVSPAQLYTDITTLVLDSSPAPGQAAEARLFVGNAGDQTSGPISANISAGSSGFAVSPATCTGQLTTGGICSFDVSFTPTASGGPSVATVHVTSDPGGAFDVPVEADGQAPAAIKLTGHHGSDFGIVAVNSSNTLAFDVAASGNQSSGVLQAITLGPNFTLAPLAAGDCVLNSTELDPDHGCSFTVGFQASAPGAFAATLVVSSESGGSSSLPLTATAR